MAIDLNAFGQSTAKGKMEQTPNANVFNARVTAGSSVTLKPAMAVEFVSRSAVNVEVVALTSEISFPPQSASPPPVIA